MLEDDANGDIYDRMLAKLRDQVQHVRVDLEREHEGDALDIDDALVACAELLTDAVGLWVSADAGEKSALQRFYFPSGMTLERCPDSQEYTIGTDVACSAFSMLAAAADDDSSMASHAELSWNQAIAWLRNMAALRENPVFAGDSEDSGSFTSPRNAGISTP